MMIASLIYRNIQKRRESELIRLAIEKGQQIPIFSDKVAKYGALKVGLIWIAVAIGWMAMIILESNFDWNGVSIGLIPLFIGIALILGWLIEKNSNGEKRTTA